MLFFNRSLFYFILNMMLGTFSVLSTPPDPQTSASSSLKLKPQTLGPSDFCVLNKIQSFHPHESFQTWAIRLKTSFIPLMEILGIPESSPSELEPILLIQKYLQKVREVLSITTQEDNCSSIIALVTKINKGLGGTCCDSLSKVFEVQRIVGVPYQPITPTLHTMLQYLGKEGSLSTRFQILSSTITSSPKNSGLIEDIKTQTARLVSKDTFSLEEGVDLLEVMIGGNGEPLSYEIEEILCELLGNYTETEPQVPIYPSLKKGITEVADLLDREQAPYEASIALHKMIGSSETAAPLPLFDKTQAFSDLIGGDPQQSIYTRAEELLKSLQVFLYTKHSFERPVNVPKNLTEAVRNLTLLN